jgi:diguanylate cyclase (GGDEF)-like protein
MGRSSRHSATNGSRLFSAYVVASLVPVVLLGLILYRGYQREGVDHALSQGEAQASVIEQMAIAPVLGRRDLALGLRPSERAGLLRATELASFSGSVIRLRLRTFGGRVVFSDDGSTADSVPASGRAFRRAAAGGRDISIVADPTGEPGRVIRVLQPVVPNASGQATGVLEVYLPYAPIAAQARAQLRSASLRLAAVLAGLYAVLALISWSTTRRLRRHAAESAYQARHDALTGVPNRQWFGWRAARELEAGGRGAVVVVDLDAFKEVNDTLGHHAGDELLRIVARRLVTTLRSDDSVARLGGDEFALLLPGVADAEEALGLVGRVREGLCAPLTLESLELRVEASFGVALYPGHGTTLEELLQCADTAMYHGKRRTAGIVLYEPEAQRPTTDRLLMHGELRRALDCDELVLYYQPKVDVRSGKTCGVEALLRWQHPERGLLAPGEFLPAAEQSGLIDPLTTWVVRRALSDRREWKAAGVNWPVSVNVSARNLDSPTFAGRIQDLLAEAGAAASDLCVEVTETALAGNAERAARTLEELTARGVAVSIDDFGTGFTGFLGLRTLAIAEIKIDRAFVMNLAQHEHDRSIVGSIIQLAHGLGCTVTAEGVETAEAAAWLREATCDHAQGYHFTRPARWQDLVARLADTPAIANAGNRDERMEEEAA